MVVMIARKRSWLWRAVDREGEILDVLVQSRRNTEAAVRLMRKLLRKQGFAPEASSPINSDPMAQGAGASASRHGMSKVCGRTIGPRTRISR